MTPDPSIDHRLDDRDEHVHVGVWNNALEPVLSIEPGAVVEFECRDATNGALDADSTASDLASMTFEGHPLTGPVRVEGAEPGDVLEVEFLGFEHRGFGVTYFYPEDAGKGLLPAEFDEPGLHAWRLEGDVGRFVDGIEVPLDPFPGIAGVAPAAPGDHGTTPPRRVGGNLDVKHLTAGSTLYLPVEVAGALFSVGDCHAAQGDGEVCVTGIEAPMAVTARLSLRRDLDLEGPRFETTGPFTPTGSDERMYGTTGVADDLLEAARLAVRSMIDHLEAERGLSRSDAYLLCSAAVDLKVNQVVNEPNYTVSAYLPESLFPDGPTAT